MNDLRNLNWRKVSWRLDDLWNTDGWKVHLRCAIGRIYCGGGSRKFGEILFRIVKKTLATTFATDEDRCSIHVDFRGCAHRSEPHHGHRADALAFRNCPVCCCKLGKGSLDCSFFVAHRPIRTCQVCKIIRLGFDRIDKGWVASKLHLRVDQEVASCGNLLPFLHATENDNLVAAIWTEHDVADLKRPGSVST